MRSTVGRKTCVRQQFVGISRVQVETNSKFDEISFVHKPRLFEFGIYLFRLVGRIIWYDTVQYSPPLLYSKWIYV